MNAAIDLLIERVESPVQGGAATVIGLILRILFAMIPKQRCKLVCPVPVNYCRDVHYVAKCEVFDLFTMSIDASSSFGEDTWMM